MDIPSGKRLHNELENTIVNGKTLYKSPFSIAILTYPEGNFGSTDLSPPDSNAMSLKRLEGGIAVNCQGTRGPISAEGAVYGDVSNLALGHNQT